MVQSVYSHETDNGDRCRLLWSTDIAAGHIRTRMNAYASTIAAVRGPLQQDFQSQKNVPQRARPCLFLAELLLYRRLPDLVLHNPE